MAAGDLCHCMPLVRLGWRECDQKKDLQVAYGPPEGRTSGATQGYGHATSTQLAHRLRTLAATASAAVDR